MMNINYGRMPGPPPGRFPPNPYSALAPRAAMSMANHRFAPTAFSGSARAFYQNGYESGNDNRRRNAHRLRSERAEYKHMRNLPQMHAGIPHLGGYGLPGHRPSHLPGMYNHAHMYNPNLAHMRPRPQSFRLPMPRRPAHYGIQMPARGTPYGFRQQLHSYPRRPYPMFPRGYPPPPAGRRSAYPASPFGVEEEDDDDDDFDFSHQLRSRRGRRDIFNDTDDDDDLDDDDFSTSSMRDYSRYSTRPSRRFGTEWSEDEEDDDNIEDEWDRDSRFGQAPHRGAYRSYGDSYTAHR